MCSLMTNAQELCTGPSVDAKFRNQVIGDLACNMFLLEAPMSQSMLSSQECVTAVLTIVDPWCRGLLPQAEVCTHTS